MLNIGVVGTGWFSGVHTNILQKMEGLQIKAICGTSMEKAAKFANKFDDANGYDNLIRMLDKENLDAVYICVPPFAHQEIESELISRGIPFLVEKPLDTDVKTPKEILLKLDESSVITSVGYHFRYRETTNLLKAELEEQTLGMITGGWMGSMPTVPWWRNQETSGGQFIEQTTHLVDLLRYTVGEVKEIYAAYGKRSIAEQYENVSVHDVGTVTMTFENGVIANLSNTCILPEGVSNVGLDYYTNKGILHIGFEGIEMVKKGKKQSIKETIDPYVKENEAFIHAIRTGDTSRILSTYHDAFKTQKVTVAALTSAKTGAPVRI
ncbi:MAG TPA: Gfo/Idh/MocA family oxidoreductase [Metabacillus sp.]|nr:Gfo/Idh/MocA family oxidoreductase [Metabacillus sp.]